VKKPRIAFSDAAIADILEQSDWYEAQADRSLAQRWEEAVTDTLLRIAQKPTAGSHMDHYLVHRKMVQTILRRTVTFATEASEELRYPDYMGAEANCGGPWVLAYRPTPESDEGGDSRGVSPRHARSVGNHR